MLSVNLLNMMRSSKIEIEEKPPNIMNRNSKISRKITQSHRVRRDNSFKMYHSTGELPRDFSKTQKPKLSMMVQSSNTHGSKNSRNSGNATSAKASSKVNKHRGLRKKSQTSLSSIFKGSQE